MEENDIMNESKKSFYFESNWAWLLLFGIFAIIFGISTFFLGNALQILIMTFGTFAFVNGFISLILSYKIRRLSCNFDTSFFIYGIFGIIIGLIVILWPWEMTNLSMILIGIWAFVAGALQSFISLSNMNTRGWLVFLLSGILSLIFGILVIINPVITQYAISLYISISAIIWGIIIVLHALSWKGYHKKHNLS